MRTLSRLHAAVFRAARGAVGGRVSGNGMLLLTTTGRRTGKPRTVPLLYLEDAGSYLVAASYGGRPHHPDWFLNLRHDPAVTIQVGSSRTAATASVLATGERARWWPRFVAAHAGFGTYQERTHRVIPVVRLAVTDAE